MKDFIPEQPSLEFMEIGRDSVRSLVGTVTTLKAHSLMPAPTTDDMLPLVQDILAKLDGAVRRVQGNRRGTSKVSHADAVLLLAAELRVLVEELEGIQ